MLTKAELLADGCVPNPNMWIGDGWLYCKTCEAFQFHRALSHPGVGDCYECCLVCNTYTGRLPLKGSAMPVASDILASAKEFTERYSRTLLPSDSPAAEAIRNAGLPTRVYVLLQSNTVLGVLSVEQKALDEAHSLMHAYGGTWETQVPNRRWSLGLEFNKSVEVEISAHDVR